MSLTSSLHTPVRSLLCPLIEPLARREREVRDTLWLVLTYTWILIPHLIALPLWFGAVAICLLVWRTWLTWKGKQLPHRFVLIVLISLIGIAIYSQYGTVFGKDAGVVFVVLLLGLKLLEMRARRDIFVVIFLCLFVMLTSFFESQTMLDAVAMGIGLLLLTTALISTNFVAYEPSYATKLKLAGQLMLYALPLMAALFVLFPRVQGPLWGLPSDAFRNKTGLSDSMSPGSFDSLSESNEIALRAEFENRVPEPSERYWRGPVFDHYDGRTWIGTQHWPLPSTELQIKTDPASALDYTVTLEVSNRPWLMVLEATPAAPLDLGSYGPGLVRHDLQVVTQSLVHERLRYGVRSYTRYQVGLNEDLPHQQQWLELPAGFNPRTLALAAQWQSEEATRLPNESTADPAAINRRLVARTLRWIRTENFVYTLKPPTLGHHAIDQFLFDTRRGFCEHYASAFVVLMRALDIPARVVTGYQGGEINPVDGYLEVRQRDAHAWAEVWLADQGWMRVDPTAAVAPERIEQGVQEALGQTSELSGLTGSLLNLRNHLRFNWEAIGNAWNQWVLGYGTDRQSNLLSGLGIEKIDWQNLTMGLIAVFGGLLALIGMQLIRRRQPVEPIVQLYAKLCERVARMSTLSRTGDQAQRLAHEGPKAYLARVLLSLPTQHQADVQAVFALYEQIRYGQGDNNSQLIKRLKTDIEQLLTFS